MDESLESVEFRLAKKYAKTIEQWLLGKDTPALWMRIVFLINLGISLVFIVWHGLSLYALSTSDLILEKKGIDIVSILQNHAEVIGLNPATILDRLLVFQYISVGVWSLFLIHLIFFWRKKLFAFWVHLFCVLAYFGTIIFYFNFNFFNQDIRLSDKVLLGIVIVSLGVSYAVLYARRNQPMPSNENLPKRTVEDDYFEVIEDER